MELEVSSSKKFLSYYFVAVGFGYSRPVRSIGPLAKNHPPTKAVRTKSGKSHFFGPFWEGQNRAKSGLGQKRSLPNRHLFLVTHSPRKNVWHPGFIFLAVLALRSSDCIETCDIYREKHSCRCHVLPELHKTTSMLPRPIDVRDATTRSIAKWESMCSMSLTQLACAFRS